MKSYYGEAENDNYYKLCTLFFLSLIYLFCAIYYIFSRINASSFVD